MSSAHGLAQLRAILKDDIVLKTAPASGKFTKETITGVHLAIPVDFFYDDVSKAPKVWGYIGTVVRKAPADAPAFWVKFHDGELQFYLNSHPDYLKHGKLENAKLALRFLNSPKVKIVSAPIE